jgi:hypothetical protein
LEAQILKIDTEVSENRYPYKNEGYLNGRLVSVNDIDFWDAPSVFTTESRLVRIRVLWTPGNILLHQQRIISRYKDRNLNLKTNTYYYTHR